MKVSINLKPCPFCGGDGTAVVVPDVHSGGMGSQQYISCMGCQARSQSFYFIPFAGEVPQKNKDNKKALLSSWNSRLDPKPVSE